MAIYRYSKFICLSLLLGIAILLPKFIHAKPLVADIDSRGIEIHSSFTGKDLLLFGARQGAGHIVLIIRGPKTDIIVRKKGQVAGIWLNKEQVTFKNVDSFYKIATTAPLDKLRNNRLLELLQISDHNNNYDTDIKRISNEELSNFQDSLFSYYSENQLYPNDLETSDISFIGDTLFRTSVSFPKKIPRGIYSVEFYLFNDGKLVALQNTPLIVKKIGFDAFVYNFAYKHPALYGITAILIALFSGWFASVVFRKM